MRVCYNTLQNRDNAHISFVLSVFLSVCKQQLFEFEYYVLLQNENTIKKSWDQLPSESN